MIKVCDKVCVCREMHFLMQFFWNAFSGMDIEFLMCHILVCLFWHDMPCLACLLWLLTEGCKNALHHTNRKCCSLKKIKHYLTISRKHWELSFPIFLSFCLNFQTKLQIICWIREIVSPRIILAMEIKRKLSKSKFLILEAL